MQVKNMTIKSSGTTLAFSSSRKKCVKTAASDTNIFFGITLRIFFFVGVNSYEIAA